VEARELVGRSLSQAFADDPFYQAVTVDFSHDNEKRNAVLSRYFELAIEEALRVGEVELFSSGAAAIWITDKADQVEVAASSEMRTRALKGLLGRTGFDNYRRIGDAMAANVPARLSHAWYLSILGVHPSLQGRGVARELLRSTLNRADSHGARCFLETFNPLSLPFYERAGFRQEIRCVEAITGRPYWILSR
jgi:GNAT superfamily N-acetyltransferase